MKICPTCQTTYADDSNIFCLNDGTTLVDAQNFRQPPQTSSAKSSAPLVLAILGGFAIFAVIIGGVGLYLFTRGSDENRNEEPKSNANAGVTENRNKTTAPVVNANRGLSSVEIETNRASNVKAQTSPAALPIIASASSVRRQDKGIFYFPTFAFDKNPNTAWCEGTEGAGVGEWIDFQFNREVRLRQINIQPGYFKSPQIWRDNNRVKAVLIEFSDGTSRTAAFSDQMQAQTVDVGQKQTRWVRLTIEDVYRGAHDAEDTLISEVSFVTEP